MIASVFQSGSASQNTTAKLESVHGVAAADRNSQMTPSP